MNTFWSEHTYLLYIGCMAGFTYFVFTLKSAVKSLEKWKDNIMGEIFVIKEKQAVLREIMPEKYVLNERYEIHIREINKKLDKIADKLDGKINKAEWDNVDRRG